MSVLFTNNVVIGTSYYTIELYQREDPILSEGDVIRAVDGNIPLTIESVSYNPETNEKEYKVEKKNWSSDIIDALQESDLWTVNQRA